MTVFDSLLNHTFTAYRRDRIADGQGGWEIVWTDLGTLPGRMRPASSAERDAAMQEGRDITHVFYCHVGTGIERGDRLEYGDLLVDVMGVREPSVAGHHLEIDCMERQPEMVLPEVGS